VGLRDDIRRRQQALQAGADAEAAGLRLPRAVPGPGEGVIVLTCWAPWRHLPRNAYGPPAFRVGGHEFWPRWPARGWFRDQEVTVPVAVPAGVVDIEALRAVGPWRGSREWVPFDRVRLDCRAGETLHLEFVAPNLARGAEGAFRLPGEGPDLRFLNASLAVAPLLVAFAVAVAWSFWDDVARHRADQVLPHLFDPGLGSLLRLVLFALAPAAVVTGVWAGLRPRGPLWPMRTEQTRARAAATAAATARAASDPPSDPPSDPLGTAAGG